MTLGDALWTQRSRNLDLLRLCLAMAVICSHAWPLALGPGTPEPLQALTGRSLGGWAVGVFFFISGLLITASAERKGARSFWTARARRIVPGLWLALLVTLALAMPSGSTAGFLEMTSWFGRAITLVSIEHRLTDAFAANPYPEVVNGPLWSLFHEVAAYAICAAFVWAGGTRRSLSILALLGAAGAMALAQDALPGRVATFAPLFAAFALGMAAHVWRHHIALRAATTGLACVLALVLPEALAIGFVGYCLVALALSLPVVTLKGDLSYGMYIYGWPVAQTIVAMRPGIDPVELALLGIIATYPFALLSWHLVERPGVGVGRVAA